MNLKAFFFVLSPLLFATLVQAQWHTETYTLRGGWNAIYLHGDATYAVPGTGTGQLFALNPEVLEVWRWNPNPNQVQFTATPLIPSGGTAEWTVWKRDGSATALTQMIGQSAYLVRCKGTAIAAANLTTGSVASISIVDGGSGYSSAPVVTLAPPPSGITATATATISGGAVTGFTITNAGSGYTTPPTVTIAAPSTQPTYTIPIKQKVLPPSANWVRNGANLLGFPTFRNGSNFPLFTNYFASFPAAITANTRVFRYTSGELGASNPFQIINLAGDRVDRTQAYWFDAKVVGNFYAPIEVNLSNQAGIAFARTGSVITARVRNRTAASITVRLTHEASQAKPSTPDDIAAGPQEETVVAAVPLTQRTFNAGTQVWDEVALDVNASYTVVIAPQSTEELSFGIDRNHASMTGAAADALFASRLKLTDQGGNLIEIHLPVTARKQTLAGLWLGDALVSEVQNRTGIPSSGTTVPRPMQVRLIVHVDDAGVARLLSQVFVGKLNAPPLNAYGLCTKESGLLGAEKKSASRIFAAHLPLDLVLGNTGAGNTGNISPGGAAMTRRVIIPFNDRTNPFVHAYHPDHDNKGPGASNAAAILPAGVESYDLQRDIALTFSATAPVGSSPTGWGSTRIGGTYAETFTGLHRQTICVRGTFELRRVSEIGSISITP